uniref:Amine oxidase n=1 Tax=Pelusios castaneus TaxID=367368 RepID=A0A8C8RBS8_9SAUR
WGNRDRERRTQSPEVEQINLFSLFLRYKLAVTKRKEEELTSTSMYNQNDPWTPTVAFADFIDNETIDLVAWISVGFLHIPHAEDNPNTVTVGNGVDRCLSHCLQGFDVCWWSTIHWAMFSGFH